MATYEQIQQHLREDVERAVRTSVGSMRDVESVARMFEPSCIVEAVATKFGCLRITSKRPMSDEAKEQIRRAAPVVVLIDYVVDDPWVKVGTTTIDGTLVDIANVLDVSSWPIDWDRDAVAAIDLFMRAQEPWLVGGRHLVAKQSHVNEHAGTAIIHCDIVRRQSEIEAEGAAKQAEFDREVATMEARDYPYGLPRPPCPECGPHGNRGEVLLASSWAKCTTCAGGKPGDLWGEVKAHEPATAQEALSSALIAKGASTEVAQAGVRAFMNALEGRLPRVSRGTLPDVLAAARVHAPDTTIYVDNRSVTAYIDTDRPLSDGAKHDIHMAAPAAVRLVFRTRST